ncbi:surface antigen-domain-containing protein [Schizophyllum amplum]|uniref:Surface antigen-domain-containing protein n=1 Tax=Schizophyllum amplum TaxID=97359 RepID=A0A550CX17_9AGAR|nr:surface antigen-domain-containing protein [Auriculariopsis ampla]
MGIRELFYPLEPPLQNSSNPRDEEPSEDLKKVLQWQDERMKRRLGGMYRSEVLHLSQLVNDNLKSPIRLSSIVVEGADHTRDSFLRFLARPHLAKEHETLEDVLHTGRYLSHLLQKTDVYSHVEARIEGARDLLAGLNDVDLVFRTKERGRIFLKTSTELGNNEGSASMTARLRNVFGGAEMLDANVSFGTKTRRAFTASLSAPLTSDLDTGLLLTGYGLQRDWTNFASCMEEQVGGKAAIKRGTPDVGAHELAYEGVVRHIGNLAPTASMAMRQSAGQSTKSAVSYTYSFDNRDDRISATRGLYAKFLGEFAGVGGGDARFLKTEAEAQASRRITDHISLAIASKTGLLYGLGDRPPLFPDKFRLGGPLSIRSFKASGMGPRDGPDHLGGDFYWSTGLSVITDIPRRPQWPVKLHGWVNAGRLDGLQLDSQSPRTPIQRASAPSLVSQLQASFARPAVSVGLGLVYRFDPVRIELNFGVPLVASESDATRKGLQVGMGLEFL